MTRANPRDPLGELLLVGGLGLAALLVWRALRQPEDRYPGVVVTRAATYYEDVASGRIYGGGAGLANVQ